MINNFSIFALGVGLDANAVTQAIPLPFDEVWQRGDPLPTCRVGQYATSGVRIILGDGRTVAVRVQEQLAIAFIRANQPSLRTLASYPGVESCILGLQYLPTVNPIEFGFVVSHSLALMELAVTTGIRPVVYVAAPPIPSPLGVSDQSIVRRVALQRGIARAVGQLRKQTGLTREAMAERLGITLTTDQEIEATRVPLTLDNLIPAFFAMGGTSNQLAAIVKSTDDVVNR